MRRKIPPSHALLCFESAARYRSFTRAAQELALTQSAVSRQIQALEDYIGLSLFVRGRHGVSLTQAGLDYAAKVDRLLNALERDTRELMTGHHGGHDLRLACVATFATQWLIPRLPELREEHPGLTVHIETRTRPFLFADSGIDAAIFAGTREQMAQWPGTQSVYLQDEAVIPVCSPAHLPQGHANPTLSASDIAQLTLIQQSTRPNAWAEWFEAMQTACPQAHQGPRYELFSMSCAAAAAGLGVALVPRLLVEGHLRRGELRVAHTTPLPSQRHYHLVFPDSAHAPASLRHFQAWLERASARDRDRMGGLT